MRRLLLLALGLALFGFAAFLVLTQPRARDMAMLAGLSGDAARGETVFRATGCASCHMAPGATGDAQLLLVGGQKFASPFGTFIAPNISPDPTEGIGGWSLQSLAGAIQDGVTPEGQHYFPALPYNAYGKMAAQDVADLKTFLDTLPAATTPSLPHQIGFPFNIRRTLGLWKLMFQSDDWVMAGDLSPQLTRGRYLVEAMAHCGECHTPRNLLGGLKTGQWLGGAANPAGKGTIPNITPGKLDWSEAEIVEFLTTGFMPDFDSAGGAMAEVVANMARLPIEDRQAVAAYLKAVPAVQ